MNLQLYIDIFLILALAISYFMYKHVVKKHQEDPDYEKNEAERINQLREKQRQDEELDAYMAQSDDEYND